MYGCSARSLFMENKLCATKLAFFTFHIKHVSVVTPDLGEYSLTISRLSSYRGTSLFQNVPTNIPSVSVDVSCFYSNLKLVLCCLVTA